MALLQSLLGGSHSSPTSPGNSFSHSEADGRLGLGRQAPVLRGARSHDELMSRGLRNNNASLASLGNSRMDLEASLSIGVDYYNHYPLLSRSWRDRERTREIFGLIVEAASRSSDGEASCHQLQEQIVEDRDSGIWATYTAFGNAKIHIHVGHMAASLGSVDVLETLSRDTSLGVDILNKQSILEKGSTTTLHYTPLMSALFMSKTKVVIWLLDHGAEAQTENADGLTPCHLLAQFGLTEEGADDRIKSLGSIIEKLVEKSADLSRPSGEMEGRTDPVALRIRSRTPLEIAVQNEFQYPKQALHLLTQSFHCPSKGQLFKEVNIIAKANPNAAELLLGQMHNLDITMVRRQLSEEVQRYFKEQQHVSTFVETLRKSPAAGVKLLDLLMMEPRLTNKQRYPLPLYTVLPDDRMVCSYQRAGTGDGRPVWGKAPLISCKNQDCRELLWEVVQPDIVCSKCPKGGSSVNSWGTVAGCGRGCGYALCKNCWDVEGPECKNRECNRMWDLKQPRNKCARCKEHKGTVASCCRDCGYSLCEDCEREEVVEIQEEFKNSSEKLEVVPSWHLGFRKDLPEDPLTHRNVHEVLVRVLHLPGVITLPVLSVLSLLPHDANHRKIFSEVSVNGIICAVWELFTPLFLYHVARGFFVLLVLLVMGLYPQSWKYGPLRIFMHSVIIEHMLSSFCNLVYGMVNCTTRGDEKQQRRLQHQASGRFLGGWFAPRRWRSRFVLQRRMKMYQKSRKGPSTASRMRNLGDTSRSKGTLVGLPGGRRPWLSYLLLFGFRDVGNLTGLSCLLAGVWLLYQNGASNPLDTGVAKVLVTSNVLLQCFGLMALLRVLQVIGPLILAVFYSFVPMRGMFLLMGTVFTTFSFVFVIIRDPTRSVYFVLIYLYQALILADRDTSATISGLDMAREQTLDFGQELYKGGGDEAILQFSLIVAIAASTLFSLVLLNLTIGMYTKFYDQIEPEGERLLQQQRAKRCVAFMMQPPWRLARIKNLWRRMKLFTLTVVLFLTFLFMVWLEVQPCFSALLLLVVEQLWQVVLLYNIADIEERSHYLWVSYRADWQQPKDATDHLRKEIESIKKKYVEELGEMRRVMAALSSNQADSGRASGRRATPAAPNSPEQQPRETFEQLSAQVAGLQQELQDVVLLTRNFSRNLQQ